MTIKECEAFYTSLQKNKIFVKKAEDVIPALHKYRYKKQEHFIAILLNQDLSINKVKIITKGLVNRTMIRPLEAFRECIKQGTPRIIFAHNHPSGTLNPSKADINFTNSMRSLLKELEINQLDHVIIGTSGHYSFLEENLL